MAAESPDSGRTGILEFMALSAPFAVTRGVYQRAARRYVAGGGHHDIARAHPTQHGPV